MAYKHGVYGEIKESKAASASQSETVAVYFGLAPINLIRNYDDAGIINNPVKISNMLDAQQKVGYAKDWSTFTLAEALAAHFDNIVANVGPIYLVNVLDPDVHKAAEATSKDLTFKNGFAEFESEKIILDTFAIADKAEGVDYTLSYNFSKGTVIVKALTEMADPTSCTYYEIDTTAITKDTIIGSVTDDGEYKGIAALQLLYTQENAVANIIAAPGWSSEPSVYIALCSAAQKINGHWDAFVCADIPIDDSGAVDTIAKAIAWKSTNGYTSEISKACWPKFKDGSGRIFNLSSITVSNMMRVDQENNSIPFESPSNKSIPVTAQYFGETSKNKGFSVAEANLLNEKGITTGAYWAGKWVIWGPHTAAYIYNGSMDARAIFDVNIRMLMYITNKFQLDHGTKIDKPMTPALKETILNYEKEKLDTLKGIGALIGEPEIEFIETENPINNMVNGDFVWDINVTNTPPFKSGTVRVCYTDEGFAAFYGGE